jgi:hypothetical protein
LFYEKNSSGKKEKSNLISEQDKSHTPPCSKSSNGPILKSAKRRKTLSPGPEKKHKILCFSIKDVTLIIIIMD